MKKKSELECPQCGHDIFGCIRPVSGTWYQAIKITGSKYEVIDGQDNIRLGLHPKKIQCEKCDKRIPNPLAAH